MNSKTIYHKHHIIPRHMGGTDDPSNLVELTVEEHAEAHRLLYEEHGKQEDYLAWRSLSGLIGKEEYHYERSRLGGLNGKGRILTKEHKEKIAISQIGEKNSQYGKSPSKKTLNKRKKTFKKIRHSQGKRNSQYGTCWITNGVDNKKIKKDDSFPNGWYRGRVAAVKGQSPNH